jgi:membrane-associated protease RseP (regulator of RpoE activity)
MDPAPPNQPPARRSPWGTVGIVVGALAILAVVFCAGGVAGYSYGRISTVFALRANVMPYGFMMRPSDPYGGQGWMPHNRLGPLGAGVAYLGVTYGEVDPSRAEKEGLSLNEGAEVSDVVQGSPADEAGLQPGDIILAVDGQRLTKAALLRRLVQGHLPGDEVSLLVLHDGGQVTLTVVLGQAPIQPAP